jgi:MFS family permease
MGRLIGARPAVTTVFFVNGAVFSSWYARLPAIKEQLDIGPGAVGLALLGAPLGLLVAQPLVGALVSRRGSRPLVAAAPLLLAPVVLPALAVDTVTLFAAVTVVGAANGALDIAMNAQGLTVERSLRRRLFSSLHAAFSFGALSGAALAAAAAGAGVQPLPHLAAAAALGGLTGLTVSRSLVSDEGVSDSAATPLFARPSRRLAVLGAIAFCALLAEGAIFDWSSILLATEYGAGEGVAPVGLAAFSLTMGIGRLVADAAADRRGEVGVARWGAVAAACGIGVALVGGRPGIAIAGFALMGLGLASVFPLALRAAGGRPRTTGPDLAAVSTVGYTGFLLGPPAIGLLAELSSLRAALFVVCAACAVAAVLAPRVGVPAARASDAPAAAQ